MKIVVIRDVIGFDKGMSHEVLTSKDIIPGEVLVKDRSGLRRRLKLDKDCILLIDEEALQGESESLEDEDRRFINKELSEGLLIPAKYANLNLIDLKDAITDPGSVNIYAGIDSNGLYIRQESYYDGIKSYLDESQVKTLIELFNRGQYENQ